MCFAIFTDLYLKVVSEKNKKPFKEYFGKVYDFLEYFW